MDRNQQYLTTLLEKVPKWELSDSMHQDAFDRIKTSLTNSPDLQNQLRELYKVSNFSEFALGLMWIVNRIEHDPSRLESTMEEESFVLNLLKKAFGGPSGDSAPSGQPFGFDGSRPPMADSLPLSNSPGISQTSSASESSDAFQQDVSDGSETEFSTTLEKLLEAVQSGSEERTVLLDELTRQAEGIVAAPASDNDYKTFCGYLMEFLRYVSSNQLFDDIRVMNLISNVYDPFSQWAKTDAGSRSSMLEQSIEMLRDFKALFE